MIRFFLTQGSASVGRAVLGEVSGQQVSALSVYGAKVITNKKEFVDS